MSKKRTSTETSEDEPAIDDSDTAFQRGNDAKRAKLTSLSDTKLQDLPNELVESILFEAVVMEVKDRRLAKRVWKKTADRVIDRLGTVCSQWNSVLATDFFRNKVHKTLDLAAPKMFRMEILHRFPMMLDIISVDAIRDEIFLLCETPGEDKVYAINVYDRSNMAEVKDVIPLPEVNPESMKACSVSDCLYVLNGNCASIYSILGLHPVPQSLLRVKKDDNLQWKMSPWMIDFDFASSSNNINVFDNGCLVILSNQRESNSTVISIYSADGSLQHRLLLSQGAYGFHRAENVILLSNGNLLLVSFTKRPKLKLFEINMNGRIVRTYRTSFIGLSGVIFTDIYGRIMLADMFNRIDLLDSEFNPMDFTGPEFSRDQFTLAFKVTYNSKTNEALADLSDNFLTIFRFTEETITQHDH